MSQFWITVTDSSVNVVIIDLDAVIVELNTVIDKLKATVVQLNTSVVMRITAVTPLSAVIIRGVGSNKRLQ